MIIGASGYNDLPADWQAFGVLADIGLVSLCAVAVLAVLLLAAGIVIGCWLLSGQRP